MNAERLTEGNFEALKEQLENFEFVYRSGGQIVGKTMQQAVIELLKMEIKYAVEQAELAVKDRIKAKVHKKMAKFFNATLKEIEITKVIDEA